MVRDRIINQTAKEIQEGLKQDLDVEVSVDDILEVVDWQSRCTADAITKGKEVRLDYLGKFTIKLGMKLQVMPAGEEKDKAIKAAREKRIKRITFR